MLYYQLFYRFLLTTSRIISTLIIFIFLVDFVYVIFICFRQPFNTFEFIMFDVGYESVVRNYQDEISLKRI